MIIWQGFGFLVFVFVFGFSLIAKVLTNALTGSDAYWEAHKWPFAESLIASAAASAVVGKWFQRRNERNARVLVDPQTGETVQFRQTDSLFFIPMHYWTGERFSRASV